MVVDPWLTPIGLQKVDLAKRLSMVAAAAVFAHVLLALKPEELRRASRDPSFDKLEK
jgi:hypothetical protein